MVYVEISREVLEEKRRIEEEEKEKGDLLRNLKGEENITLDGRKINLYANIGNVSDLGAVLQNDAQEASVCSEVNFCTWNFKYVPYGRGAILEVYKRVAETMGGKKVIIRTLDIEYDKQVGLFQYGKRRESGFRISCNPYLSGSCRYF